MSREELPLHILAVDCQPRGQAEDVRLLRVETAREALLALRDAPIDLLLTTRRVDGAPVWPLAEKVRRLRPKVRWWLIARGLGPDEEIVARTLGVTRIVSAAPRLEAIRLGFARAGPAPSSAAANWIDLEVIRASP